MDYYLYILIVLLVSGLSAAYVKLTYMKFEKVESKRGITAEYFADRMLTSQKVYGVSMARTSGKLTDFYSPKDNSIHLSESTYGKTNLAAIGVAAHEAGHALQYATNYGFIGIRNSFRSIVNLTTPYSGLCIMLGLLLGGAIGEFLFTAGVAVYVLIFLFSVLTLPIEFNASHRAIDEMTASGLFTSQEIASSRKVLFAAAMTYVASCLTSLLGLLRLLLMNRSRRR